jgi:hypothetical protein
MVQIIAAYIVLALLFVTIGAHARRGSAGAWAGAKGGAAAGLVIAIGVTVTIFVIDNAFFGIVSQQHDKRLAFAASGWSSMRAFINFQILTGTVFVLPAATAVGAALGGLGGAIFRNRAGQPDPVG